MRNKAFNLLFVCNFVMLFANAQVDQKLDNLKNVVPPSPNSASLGKYGEWPVSLYTGLPGISIPICELKGKDITIPISLSYHSSGIRVTEIASQVGLGWSLNAGGIISRTVKGIPDEEGYFSASLNYSNPDNLCGASSPSEFATQHKVSSAKGEMDSQQDIYNLSALGVSYRLMIKADGTILTLPYSNVKITRTGTYTLQTWTVLTEDGTKMIFGGGDSFTEVNNSPQFAGPYVSTWYLKSITSTKGDVINLTYTLNGQLNEDTYITENDVIKYSLDMNGVVSHLDKARSHPRQYITTYNLSSIESGIARVDFINSPPTREDVKNGSYVSEIKVFSKLGNIYTEDYVFTYNYSTCTPGIEGLSGIISGDEVYLRKRLKLLSLEKKPLSGSTPSQKWIFDYNTQSLPSRRSFAQDHWGFYNGATNNTTLLPPIYYALPVSVSSTMPTVTGFMPTYHEMGGNRDAIETNMQAEVLTKITYPTGGNTQFEYEGNGYQASKEFFGDQTISLSSVLTSTSNPYQMQTDYSFTITKPQYVQFTFSSYISPDIFNDFPGAYCSGQVLNSSDQVKFGFTNGGTQWFNLLSAGTYKLRIKTNVQQNILTTNSYISMDALLKYSPTLGVQSYKKLVGGLRIKTITNFDGISNQSTNKQNFIYENPFEINPLDEQADYITEQDEDACPGSGGPPITWHKIKRNASSKYSLGSVQGGTVGYGKVTTLNGDNGVNGKTISYFNSEEDQGVAIAKVFPYPPTESRDWRRGLLLHEENYNASNVKIKEQFNTYSFQYKYGITNFAAGYSWTYCPAWCVNPWQYCGITYTCYNISTEQVNHTSKTETLFQPDGTNPITTATNYFYDNSNYTHLSRSEVINSKNQNIKSSMKYPYDFPGTAVYDEMVNRNILNQVVEQTQTNLTQNKELSKAKINYQFWQNNALIEVSTIQKSILGNTLETETTINDYDNKGNILQLTGKDGIITSYLWGYSQYYPVAKVIGKTYADAVAQSGINLSILNNPSDENTLITELNKLRTLSGALVISYTYKPLIGISSETDARGRTTYYEYDVLNRLSMVRDNENKVIKKICYNYAGQQENCLSSCTNFTPDWQNTSTPPTCQQNSCGNTGYQLQEQRDMNPCSPTYNQTQIITVYNPTACPPPNNVVTITYQNSVNIAGFTALYTNSLTNQTYSFTIPTGSGTLGCIPPANYFISISKPGSTVFLEFGCGCRVVTGTSALFTKTNVSSTACNSITINYGY